MSGLLQEKKLLKAYQTSLSYTLEILFLILIGAFAVLLRAKLRVPINIPGHHGMEVMALLLAGRCFSKIKFASSISSISAAIFILFPFMGFKDPFLPVIYIILGITIDSLYALAGEKRKNIFLMALFAGLAYTVIPLSRLLISFLFNYPYNSFIKHGYLLPVFSHFAFGLFGGFAGAGIVNSFKKK